MGVWWQTEDMLEYLIIILSHLNEANNSKNNTDICDKLFKSLNKTWTAFNSHDGNKKRSDIASLYSLIMSGMTEHAYDNFIIGKELENLANFKPYIMDHEILKRKGYKPNQPIEPGLERDSTEAHRKFLNRYNEYKENPSKDTKERVAKMSSSLLYIIRSNIAHGEKTPYGPD